MPRHIECPFLGGVVEFSDERDRHLREAHGEAYATLLDRLPHTVRDPDVVFAPVARPAEHAFARRWAYEGASRNVVVIVVTDRVRSAGEPMRHWVVTAYVARRLPRWRIEWQRP